MVAERLYRLLLSIWLSSIIHFSSLSIIHFSSLFIIPHPSFIHSSSNHYPSIIQPAMIHSSKSLISFLSNQLPIWDQSPTHRSLFLLSFLMSLIPVCHQDKNKIIFKTTPHTQKSSLKCHSVDLISLVQKPQLKPGLPQGNRSKIETE